MTEPATTATDPGTTGGGPKPMRYDPARHAESLAALANSEPGADSTETAAESAAAPSEADTVDEETQRVFADAFGPEDDGGFTPGEYEALAAEYEADSEDPATSDTAGQADGEPASAREARYRIRAREAESRLAAAAAENSALLHQLDAMRRAQAVSLAASKLADPQTDLFREHGVEDVLDVDGTVDPQRVAALSDAITAAHPHYGIQKRVNLNALRSGATKANDAPPATNWRAAFTPQPKE